MAADANRLTDDVGAASQPLDPEAMAQHDDGMAAPDPIVFIRQQPAGQCMDTEHIEVVAAHDAGDSAKGGAIDRQVDGVGALGEKSGEDLLVFAQAAIGLMRPGGAARRPSAAQPARVQHDQFARALDRQRLEQQLVDDAEDRGIGADTERQRQDRRCRESRASP